MRRVEAMAPPALSCVIRGVIQKVSAAKGKVRPVDAVPELQSEVSDYAAHIVYGGGTHEDITERELGGRVRDESLPLLRAFGMTFMPGACVGRQEQEA
jgi:hypothetical protein